MEDTIIISEKPTPCQLNPSSKIICRVCQKQFSQYTCPRCNSRYCSLQCYKSHSLRCTESFIRENVFEELQQIQPNEGTKQNMMDILKRFHSENESNSIDEDVSTLSEEIIEKIMSGVEVSIEDLSAEDKKCFERAVASGELSKMMQPWDPWWLKPCAKKLSLGQGGTQLIQPIEDPQQTDSRQTIDSATNCSDQIPPGPKMPLLPVKNLSSTQPSPLLAVHMVDIIYGYCFTLRIYNGDWASDAVGSTLLLLSMSSVLGNQKYPETVMEALCSCLERTCSSDYKHMGGARFGMGLVDDVASLLSLGGPALICLLCDMQRLIRAGESEMRRNKVKRVERKVYFMMCWAHEQFGETWSSLADIVRAEKISFSDIVKNSGKIEPKSKTGDKVLIEV